MVNILITGGAGFIPSSLAERLLEDTSNRLVLVDNFLTGRKSNIPQHPNCTFIKCDVNDYNDISSVLFAFKFDYIFHYAAVVGVKRTLENPILVLRDIKGIENILSLAKNTGVKRVFFSSSSEVYGEPVNFPQNEHTTPLNSRLPYAIVKNVGESFCRSYKAEFNLDYTIFRFFNTYGPKQSKDFVMSKFLKSALNGEDITIYGDGSQTRTFCYIDDNIDATLAAFYSTEYINDVFNIGSDKITSIKNLAEIIIDITGSKSKLVYLPPLEEGDMTKRQPDISKMKTLLKRDMISLEVGIKKVLESWKKK